MRPLSLTPAFRGIREADSVTMRCPHCDHPVTIRDDASPLPVACAGCGRHYSTEFYLMVSAHIRIWNRTTATGAIE